MRPAPVALVVAERPEVSPEIVEMHHFIYGRIRRHTAIEDAVARLAPGAVPQLSGQDA